MPGEGTAGDGVPEVSIILVGYRTRDELTRCLTSIAEHSGDVDVEVVLVDNASGDGTAEHIAAAFPWVRLVALPENVGFARAVNLGARLSRGRYLMLLNPDTEVLPGAVRALVDAARRHPRAGLIGGRTLTETGATEPSSCWARPTLWSTFCFASGLSTALRGRRWTDPEAMPGWDRDDEREVGVVTGCLVLVPRAVWEHLGGFDERFFMYGEDTDLSLRAWEAGYRPRITPAAEVIHTIGASSSSSSTRRVMIMRGKVSVFEKHWPPRQARLGVRMLVAGVGLRAAMGLVKQRLGRPLSREQESWVGAWRARADWRHGYPPATGPGQGGIGPWPPADVALGGGRSATG